MTNLPVNSEFSIKKHFSVGKACWLMLALMSIIACKKLPMEKDVATLEEEALVGDKTAAHTLCYRYSNGLNAPLDDEKAFDWCARASAQQEPKSMTLLADLYYQGRGTKQDYNKAAKLYYYAAQRGVEKAMFMLYHHYHNGFGVAKDEAEAKYYLNRAADRRYLPAIELKQQLLIME